MSDEASAADVKEARCRAAVRCGEHDEMSMVPCDTATPLDAARSSKAQRRLKCDGLKYDQVESGDLASSRLLW